MKWKLENRSKKYKNKTGCNKYCKYKKQKEEEMFKSFQNFFEKYHIKKFEDFPDVGAYVVFDDLKDKVKCHQTFFKYRE
jgi:hypothetical protein